MSPAGGAGGKLAAVHVLAPSLAHYLVAIAVEAPVRVGLLRGQLADLSTELRSVRALAIDGGSGVRQAPRPRLNACLCTHASADQQHKRENSSTCNEFGANAITHYSLQLRS